MKVGKKKIVEETSLTAGDDVALSSISGVSFEQMKLQIKLGVSRPLQQSLNIDKVKPVFLYGKIENFEAADGGLIRSSGVGRLK